MSCGDLAGAEIRTSDGLHEGGDVVIAPVSSALTIEGRITVNAPSCSHELVFVDATRGLSFGDNGPIAPDVWEQAKSIITGLPVDYAVPATPGTYLLQTSGNHWAGGFPSGTPTFGQVESAPLTVRAVRSEPVSGALDDHLGTLGGTVYVGFQAYHGIFEDPHASDLGVAGRAPTLVVERALLDPVNGTLVHVPGRAEEWAVRGREPRSDGTVRLKLEEVG